MSKDVVPNARPLSASEVLLVEAAREVINQQGDGLVHTVGAAVCDEDGGVYVGVNLYHFTGGPCAELVALAAARTAGARQLSTIVAVGNNDRGVIAPCGRDRQVFADYYPEMRVIVPTDDGLRSVSVGDLLPLAFDWNAED